MNPIEVPGDGDDAVLPAAHSADSSSDGEAHAAEPAGQSDQPPRLTVAALQVLDQALDDLAGQYRQPTASQVRLAMRRITYDGFDPKAFGFKRFRDFLEAAAADKRIELHDRPGDVLVTRRGAFPTSPSFVRVRRDLWKAALDWSADVAHYLDLDTDKTVTVPTIPVPLEPEKFARVRQRIADQDQRLVRIPRIDIHIQVGWMEQFARTVADSELAFRLDQALVTAKPARDFAQVLRSEPEVQHVWNRLLSANVFAHLVRWRNENSLLADVRIEASPPGADENPASGPSRTDSSAPATELDAATGSGSFATEAQGATANALTASEAAVRYRTAMGEPISAPPGRRLPGASYARTTNIGTWNLPRGRDRRSRLRLALHRAIDQMPEDELARVVIPIGYLVED